MNTWAARIKIRMKELAITQEMLANKMGITRGAITHYLAGRRVPPLKQFNKLATILKADPAWLQFGTTQTPESTAKTSRKHKTTDSMHPLALLSWEQAGLIDMSKINKNDITEFIPHFFTKETSWYALRVKGDSMTASSSHNKCFHQDDILVINPDKIAKHGDYVIATLPKSKEATFKQYVIDGGIRYLKPLNPQYPIVQIDDRTHICGVVISCLSSLI